MENFLDSQNNNQEKIFASKVEIKPKFANFVPEEFLNNPVGYFEREGKNIKTGEKKIDEEGMVREDPTAVKDLPVWKNKDGREILTVGKKVNIDKGAVAESNDPFYEYKILERLAKIGLPAAKPIAKVEQDGVHIIVMERIPGIRWPEKENLKLKEQGFSDEDILALMAEAEQKMNELKIRFEQSGIVREWKLKDMIFQIDFENKKITAVIPTDWERTKIVENK